MLVEGAHESLDHSYQIRNDSGEPIRLVRAVNLKPCCGRIAFEPTELAPGDSTHLDVTLVLSTATGRLVHYATVETEPPSVGPLEFRTAATVRPRLRIEPVAVAADRSTALLPNESKRLVFRAIGLGTDGYPPPALEEAEIVSNLDVRWASPAETHKLASNLIEVSRMIDVRLPASDEPGMKTAQFRIRDARSTDRLHPISWEVVPHIELKPPIAVFSKTRTTAEMSLVAQDDRPFRIIEVETEDQETEISWEPSEESVRQIVRIILGETARRRQHGSLRVRTTHAEQPEVHIPIHILGQSVSKRE